MNAARAAPLAAILALAAGLRVPALDRVPSGLIPDEALAAYDAFSIVRTGRDAHGEPLPLFPLSTARLHCLYMYAELPFVAALGLGPWAARLPAALAGIATAWLLYLLVRPGFGRGAGLAAALALAVSPWHVLLSRTGYDWVLLPGLACLTVALLVRALARRASFWPAGLAAGLSLYGYAPIRLLLPLLLGAVAATHWPEFRRDWRRALPASLLFAALAAPVVAMTATAEGQQRLASILAPGDGAAALLSRLLASFSPSFLLAPAREPELHRLRAVGLLHGLEALLVVAGAVACLAQRSAAALLPLACLALAPLAVVVHRDAPDPVLGVVMLPWLQALAGIGAAALWRATDRGGRAARLALLAALAWGGWSVASSALDLYRDFPRYAAAVWTHGVREVVQGVEPLRRGFDDVVVDTEHKLIGSLILFHSGYDPELRQREVRAAPGRAARTQVGPYRLARLPEAAREPGRHLVWTTEGRARRLLPAAAPLLRVPFPDGRENYVVVAVDDPTSVRSRR